MSTRVRKVTTGTTPAVSQKTKVGLLLDNSGSMHRIRHSTERAFDSIVKGIQTESAASGIETEVSLMTFDTSVKEVYLDRKAKDVPSVVGRYNPDGQTALIDGVFRMINHLKKFDSEDTSFLIYVVTDGQDNNSDHTSSELQKKLVALQKTGRWTFGFQMPPRHTPFALSLGVDADNIREWETSERGMVETAQITNSGTKKYFETKVAGGTTAKVSNIFTTDLSKLSAKVIHTKLDDISDHFKEYEVKEEGRADEFTIKKTKKEYVIGQTYYLLMKQETIQPTKQILLKEKGKKAIWGGDQARELIGLPKAASGSFVKVKPGNHANYDVFIQSTSVNRKLPRGTTVLIDVTMKTGLTPTWDHTALATPASV